MCISRGAFFRFHAPKHRSAQAASYAKNYMMRKYPGWVRSWISQNRGLSNRLITMNYKYASRFIPACVTVTARYELPLKNSTAPCHMVN